MRNPTFWGWIVLGLVAVTLWLGWSAVPVPAWVSGLVLGGWIVILVAGVALLLPAAPWYRRFLVWAVLSLLLFGMVLPPDWLQTIQQGVAQWLGGVSGAGSSAPMLAHLGLYAAFAASVLWASAHRRQALVLLVVAGFAVATELMQLLVEGRHADPLDVVFNLSGIAIGAVFVWGLARFGAVLRVSRG